MEYITKNRNQTMGLGRRLAETLMGGEVLCLSGELGAGKTTFVSGLVNYFKPDTRVLSPTFIIVRHYSIKHKRIKYIYHIDLYRLDDLAAIDDLGIVELFNKSDTVLAIEWPEKMGELLPKDKIDINFHILSTNQRKLTIMLPCIDTR